MRETLNTVRHAISFTARGLGRRRGFCAAVILTVALGIAAVTSVASVAYGVLLAPLPIRDADRIVDLWGDNPTNQPKHFPLSGEEYKAFARESKTLSAVAAMDYQGTLPRLIQLGDTVASIPGALVSGNFFDVLGARPVAGRLLSSEDDRYGATFVGVISERLWRTVFGADPHIVGKQTKFYLHDMTIVGVVAGNLDFPRGAQLWASWPNYGGAKDTLTGFVDAIGRLAARRSAWDAKNELDAFLSRADEPHSGARRLVGRSLHAVAEPIIDAIIGDVRPVLRVVVGAVVLLLLVTCGNIAGLMLVHALARRREFAVRAALGAGWHRIARQTLGESAILCAAGGTLGIVCSWFAVRLFSAFAPSELPRATDVGLAIPVLAGAVLISSCVAIVFGSIPALVGARVSLTDALGERRERGASPRAQRLRGLLVGVQVAAAVAVLAAAGAVARGFQELSHRDLGFRPDHVIIARFGQTESVGNIAAYKVVMERALETIRHVPGVTHATGMIVTPFRSTGNDLAYSIVGDAPGEPTGRPMADYLGADPDYFSTLGIALRKGRTFNAGDNLGSAHVGVVDEMLAAQAWPGKDPIGQQIGVGTSLYTVVGVVASTRYRDLIAPRATLYTAFDQTPTMAQQYVAVRTSADASAVVPAVRDAVRNTDARLYLADFATMSARIDSSLMTARLSAILLAAFAIAILIVTGVGLYSVAATFVRQREFDIGLRMALGATPTEVARFVVRQVTGVVAAGAVGGLLAAVGAARIVQSITYGVSARDPLGLAVALGGVCVIAAIALAVPAAKAARANPADVLRRG